MQRSPRTILTDAQAAVHILVEQYHQDLGLIAQLNSIGSERMAAAAKISKEQDLPLRDVLASQNLYPVFAGLNSKEDALKVEQRALWDNMFYKNPVIWLMYKYQAYKGGSNEISTLRDLKKHCEPQDYICTKRFRFLNAYLLTKGEKVLTDVTSYPDAMKLPALYESSLMTSLTDDDAFMELWSQHEFYKRDGKVAKWEDYTN
jgi:hypothetical protein